MSRKNHEMIDGKLLQTDKKYAQLKLKQKEKIAEWMFQATRDYYGPRRCCRPSHPTNPEPPLRAAMPDAAVVNTRPLHSLAKRDGQGVLRWNAQVQDSAAQASRRA